jgi:hypothetical protein
MRYFARWGLAQRSLILNDPNACRPSAEADPARLPDFTVFFFDLESALDRAHGGVARGSEHLRALCRHELEALGSDDVLIFGATGFYLVIKSRPEDEALALARRLNTALSVSLLGNSTLSTDGSLEMFRIAPPSQIKANDPSGNETAQSHGDRTEAVVEESATAISTRRSRDSYEELALRGTLAADSVELTFTPVKDLRRGRATTFLCAPAYCVAHKPIITGYQAFQGLGATEFPFVDRAILAHSLKFARRLAQDNIYAAVGAPVSFETLVSSKGRSIYQEAMRAAGVADCPYIFLNVRNVPPGVTASRLADIVACLRPFARRVFVQLPDTHVPIENCGFLGASGFSLRLTAGAEISQVQGASEWLVRICEAQTALSCVESIDDERALEAVKRAGVRYGSGVAFGPASFRGNTHSLDVETFMRAAARAAKTRPAASVVALRRPGRGHAEHLN